MNINKNVQNLQDLFQNSTDKEENNEMRNKQETNKPNIELPALGAIGVGGVGLLLIISAYLLKKYRGK